MYHNFGYYVREGLFSGNTVLSTVIVYIDFFCPYSTPTPMVSKDVTEEDGRQTATTQDNIAERYDIFRMSKSVKSLISLEFFFVFIFV